MALRHAEGGLTTFKIGAGGCEIFLSCPPYFADLLTLTLTGWQVGPAPLSSERNIEITQDKDGFRICSAQIGLDDRHSDLVDALNVLFIALARHYAQTRATMVMLHCAAFITPKGETTLVIGSRKMGKSFLTWQVACRGGTVLADDILLWNQKDAVFECLGLPIRLRRPVPWDGDKEELKKGIIAGKNLAYTVKTFRPIAPAGHMFVPDEILMAKSVGDFKPVPLAQIRPVLMASRIT